MSEKIAVRAEALVETELLLHALIRKSALTLKDAEQVRIQKFPHMLRVTQAWEETFDEMSLLGSLSPSVWLYPENIASNLTEEVMRAIPLEETSKDGLGPKEYIFQRLVWLWLRGQCDGRIESEDEYVARCTKDGVKITVEMPSHPISLRFRPAPKFAVQHIRLQYQAMSKKTIHERVAFGFRLLFRRADSKLIPELKSRLTLDSLRKAAP